MLLAFLTIVMRWPCSTPNFCPIGQNLTGEFMWKYFAAFGNLFTQIAEADGVFTSAEREVKDSRRSGMYQSCNFFTRLGKQSL